MTLASLTITRGSHYHARPALTLAAILVRDAARAAAEETRDSATASRFHFLADRLSKLLGLAEVDYLRLLRASPALTERSGRNRTLIEMIEADPGDDGARLRLAQLLLRALVWRPETLPMPGRLTARSPVVGLGG